MKRNKLIVVLVIVIFISIFTSILFAKNLLLDSYKKINVDFTVGDHLGFNADPDALHFGTLPPGNQAFRDFEVHNVNCGKCMVSIKSDLDWLRMDNNHFILKKNEKRSVKLYLDLPSEAELGKYYGFIEISLWKTI